MDITFNIKLVDEIAMVFFWVGLNGILDRIINFSSLKPSKIYIYMILFLFAIYVKL